LKSIFRTKEKIMKKSMVWFAAVVGLGVSGWSLARFGAKAIANYDPQEDLRPAARSGASGVASAEASLDVFDARPASADSLNPLSAFYRSDDLNDAVALAWQQKFAFTTPSQEAQDILKAEAELRDKLIPMAQKGRLSTVSAEEKESVRKALDKLFEMKEKQRTKEIDSLEARVNQMKDLAKQRLANRDQIIDRKLASVLALPDPLSWDGQAESNPLYPNAAGFAVPTNVHWAPARVIEGESLGNLTHIPNIPLPHQAIAGFRTVRADLDAAKRENVVSAQAIDLMQAKLRQIIQDISDSGETRADQLPVLASKLKETRRALDKLTAERDSVTGTSVDNNPQLPDFPSAPPTPREGPAGIQPPNNNRL
jgi:hypothetical protein